MRTTSATMAAYSQYQLYPGWYKDNSQLKLGFASPSVRSISPTLTSNSDSDSLFTTTWEEDIPQGISIEDVQRIYQVEEPNISVKLAQALRRYLQTRDTKSASTSTSTSRGDDPCSAPKEPAPNFSVACPYHKNNPDKFRTNSVDGKRFQTCPQGFADIRRLKDHIAQVHAGPKNTSKQRCCPNCSQLFNTKEAFNSHMPKKGRNLKKDFECEPYEDPKYVDHSVLGHRRQRLFQRKAPGVCTRDAWYTIWGILFPDKSPSWPYQELNLLETSFAIAKGSVVESMADRLRREYPQIPADQATKIYEDALDEFIARFLHVHNLQSSGTDRVTMEALQRDPEIFLEHHLGNDGRQGLTSAQSAATMPMRSDPLWTQNDTTQMNGQFPPLPDGVPGDDFHFSADSPGTSFSGTLHMDASVGQALVRRTNTPPGLFQDQYMSNPLEQLTTDTQHMRLVAAMMPAQPQTEPAVQYRYSSPSFPFPAQPDPFDPNYQGSALSYSIYHDDQGNPHFF